MNKTLYLTLTIIFVAAIVAALGRQIAKDEEPMNTPFPMIVDTTDQLIAYDITDCPLDLACGQMPDTTQEDVILCVAAAFTGKCLDAFEHTNILGPHISNGERYLGYEEQKDGVPFETRYALFVWEGKDNHQKMLAKGFHSLPNDSLLDKAVEQGGMAFTQHWVIKDRQVFTPVIQPLDREEHFRALCQKDNRYYVIANREPMPYAQYLDSLLGYGIENALYMDMGTGWNHSFYRDADNRLHILHPKTHAYPTNWLVVYKK